MGFYCAVEFVGCDASGSSEGGGSNFIWPRDHRCATRVPRGVMPPCGGLTIDGYERKVRLIASSAAVDSTFPLCLVARKEDEEK